MKWDVEHNVYRTGELQDHFIKEVSEFILYVASRVNGFLALRFHRGEKKRAHREVTSLVFSRFLPQSLDQYLVPSCLIQLSHSA